MRVQIEQDLCLSSGRCVADHPAAFRFDADEIAEPAPGADDLTDDALLEAARSCPAGAILLLDATGQDIPLA